MRCGCCRLHRIVRWGLWGVGLSFLSLLVLPFLPAIGLFAYLGYIPKHAWPTNLPRLLWEQRPQQRRTIGKTSFAISSRYHPYNLSEEQLSHYYRHGWVHLPAVLPPDLLLQLRGVLLKSGVPLWPFGINGQMSHDELLDFYLFSPLGQVASEVWGGRSVFLWNDFRYWREKGQEVSSWHYDGGECGHPLSVAKHTARLRFWVSLDDDAPGPVMFSQMVYNDVLPPGQPVADYWAGKLVGSTPTEATKDFLETPLETILSKLVGEDASYLKHLATPNVRLGDVIMHNPCLVHRSPMLAQHRLLGFVCPTYMKQDSGYLTPARGSPGKAARMCKTGMKEGDVTSGHPCFPQAHPTPDHLRGKEVDFRFSGAVGDASLMHWYMGFVGRRFHDMLLWEGWYDFTVGSRGAVERPLAWVTCRAMGILYKVTFSIPGFYVA